MNLEIYNLLILFPAIFFLAVVYYLVPQKYRWIVLLVSSYGFITWVGSWSVVIIIASSLANYLFGLWIHKCRAHSRILLGFGILVNIVILGVFKYFSAQLNLDASLSTFFHPHETAILIPLGLSYYTLQNISYLVDVSKSITPAEVNPGIFLVYHAFFPKIIAGPIERGKSLFRQIRLPEKIKWSNISAGSSLILFGLFKKVVLADHMVTFVNEVFDKPGVYQGLTVLLGTVFLGFQIYLDFSGYSDIAVGIAKILGISLTVNFNRPFLSQNLVEFWNRWHISLSAWLRDYIFYPSRRFLLQKMRSLPFLAVLLSPILAMLVSGLWHGTGLTFICWGLFHAVFYTIVVVRRSLTGSVPAERSAFLKIVTILVNFGVVSTGWILFRADSLSSAWTIFKNIFVKSTTLELILRQVMYLDYLIPLIAVLLTLVVEIFMEIFKDRFTFADFPLVLRWMIYLLVILAITIFGVYQKGANIFVYGKF